MFLFAIRKIWRCWCTCLCCWPSLNLPQPLYIAPKYQQDTIYLLTYTKYIKLLLIQLKSLFFSYLQKIDTGKDKNGKRNDYFYCTLCDQPYNFWEFDQFGSEHNFVGHEHTTTTRVRVFQGYSKFIMTLKFQFIIVLAQKVQEF